MSGKKIVFPDRFIWGAATSAGQTEGAMPPGYLLYTGKEPLPTAFRKCLPEEQTPQKTGQA